LGVGCSSTGSTRRRDRRHPLVEQIGVGPGRGRDRTGGSDGGSHDSGQRWHHRRGDGDASVTVNCAPRWPRERAASKARCATAAAPTSASSATSCAAPAAMAIPGSRAPRPASPAAPTLRCQTNAQYCHVLEAERSPIRRCISVAPPGDLPAHPHLHLPAHQGLAETVCSEGDAGRAR